MMAKRHQPKLRCKQLELFRMSVGDLARPAAQGLRPHASFSLGKLHCTVPNCCVSNETVFRLGAIASYRRTTIGDASLRIRTASQIIACREAEDGSLGKPFRPVSAKLSAEIEIADATRMTGDPSLGAVAAFRSAISAADVLPDHLGSAFQKCSGATS